MFFTSADGISEVRALLWVPEGLAEGGSVADARCMLQILHGMAEHIERYRHFAEFCTGRGYIVFGHDHIGHGKSVKSEEQWGLLPMNGKDILIEDAHKLRLMMQERFAEGTGGDKGTGRLSPCQEGDKRPVPLSPCVPYLMLGHSMGSFVERLYLTLYGEGVTAAIISGTGQQSPLLSASGAFIARLLSATKGKDYRSPLLYELSVGTASKQIENAHTPLDWLSTDEAVVADYAADPGCGFRFGSSANYAITSLTGSMVKRKTIAAVPAALPLLFISGEEDPVGGKGVGVKQAVKLFRDTGHTDVTLILYEGMRHEVLNEVNKAQVYQDIAEWIEERL